MRVPRPIALGARVRIVAPSWAVDQERFQPGIEALRKEITELRNELRRSGQ